MATEKDVYKVETRWTIKSRKGTIVETSNVHWWYYDEELLSRHRDAVNTEIKDFNVCYNCIYADSWQGFTSQETIFGKPMIVHYDMYRQPFKIKEKDFISAKVEFVYLKAKGSIKDYAENLSAEDYVQYCLDKGLACKYLTEV